MRQVTEPFFSEFLCRTLNPPTSRRQVTSLPKKPIMPSSILLAPRASSCFFSEADADTFLRTGLVDQTGGKQPSVAPYRVDSARIQRTIQQAQRLSG